MSDGAGSRLVWGVNPVLEALRSKPDRVDRLLYAEGALNPKVAGEILSRARTAKLKVAQVPREKLSALTDGGVHQGVVLELRELEYVELPQLIEASKQSEWPGLIVVLDGLTDPQNVGAIIRSAHAFGAHGIVMPKDRAVGITGAVAKASAGAVEHVPVARVTNISRALETLKEAGFWSAAADPEGTQTIWEARLDSPIALVVGAEGPGVREGVLKHCDFRLRIPMRGQVASLNASVSAAVVLAEIVRQQRSA